MNYINFLKQLDKDVLFLIIGGALLVLLLIILDLFASIFKVRRRARKKIVSDGPVLEELEDQLAILSNHASLYANSLGAEGAKLLFELKSLVEHQVETLELLQMCLDGDRIEELQEFYKSFDDQTPKQKLFWITRSKQIIELLGKKLFEVSERSTNVGLPKARRRETTIESLKRWNILK